MASIKKKSERKYKITVCNGYHADGKKISRAKTITVPVCIRTMFVQRTIPGRYKVFLVTSFSKEVTLLSSTLAVG